MALLDKIKKLFGKKTPKRNKDTGSVLERYYKSFLHAIDGIIYATKYEHNIIIIICATIFAISCGLIFNVSTYEWLFIIFICAAIAACEMLNSAIEATVDLVTTEIHPLAKIAKDTASSATLILCFAALVGGIIIFVPKILELI